MASVEDSAPRSVHAGAPAGRGAPIGGPDRSTQRPRRDNRRRSRRRAARCVAVSSTRASSAVPSRQLASALDLDGAPARCSRAPRASRPGCCGPRRSTGRAPAPRGTRCCARSSSPGGVAQVGEPQPGPGRIRPLDPRALVRRARGVELADRLESGGGAHVTSEVGRGRELAGLEHHQPPTIGPLPEAIEAPRADHLALGRPRTQHDAVGRRVVADQHGEVPERPSAQPQVLEDEHRVAGGELRDRVVEGRARSSREGARESGRRRPARSRTSRGARERRPGARARPA